MRILHILDHSPPLQSGYVFRTLAILREQQALDWKTFHVTTPRHVSSEASSEVVDGWLFYRTQKPSGMFARLSGASYASEMIATARRLDELIVELAPDVLHAHSPVLNVLPALWAGRRHRVPVVYEVRALWEDGAVDLGVTQMHSLRYRLTRGLETFAMRHADHVVTICEGLRGEITARGLDRGAVTVVPNAVDTQRFRYLGVANPGLRTSLGLDGCTVLGFAGSFYAYEGLDLLIRALARLADRRPDLRVLLVGGGPQQQALQDLASQQGISSRVIFTGRVPQSEVNRYYELIDLLVYPRYRSRITDLVTPLKPLEAMAQGRVLIASDVGGHKELIRDRETGYLFAADSLDSLVETIDSALANHREWEAIRLRGREFVERERTWTASVARYASVYDRVLTRTSRFSLSHERNA